MPGLVSATLYSCTLKHMEEGVAYENKHDHNRVDDNENPCTVKEISVDDWWREEAVVERQERHLDEE